MYDIYGIADRLYKARTKKGLKQADVCKVLGIGQPSYSALETGKRALTVPELFKLAELFGVTIEWLLGINFDNDLTDEEMLELQKYKAYIISVRKK
jgi:transcriptional regulator with XRE-family HTH domain